MTTTREILENIAACDPDEFLPRPPTPAEHATFEQRVTSHYGEAALRDYYRDGWALDYEHQKRPVKR